MKSDGLRNALSISITRMKRCTYCGKEYPDEAAVCSIDQQSLTCCTPSPTTSTPQFARRHPIFTVIALSALGGVIGFAGGIAWCLHDYPDSPQAPLFGIFITGPAGFSLGLIVSVVMVVRANRTSLDDKNNAAQ
jgi:hypothetical protein